MAGWGSVGTYADSASYWQEVLSVTVAYPDMHWRQPSTGEGIRIEAALPPSLASVSDRISADAGEIASVLWALLLARLTNQGAIVLVTSGDVRRAYAIEARIEHCSLGQPLVLADSPLLKEASSHAEQP